MRDYAELVKAWRYCSVSKTCDGCPMQKNCPEISHQIVAADAIEELQAQAPHWISVEERLPELHLNDSGCVCTNTILYRTEYKTVHLGYAIRTAHNIETIDGFEQIIVDRWYDQSGDMIEDVTHWMPLPSAPKEDDNGD